MLKKNSEIVLRKVGDFYFLIDPRKSYNSDTEDIFQTNEIGAAIWNILSVAHEIDGIHKVLIGMLNEDVDDGMSEEIREDISEFVEQLKLCSFVTEV